MQLTLRYQAMHSTGPADNVEANIVPTELRADLDPAETALVLVDTWGEHPIESHRARTSEITVQRIRPVLDAARAAGVTSIFAPSPPIAATYPQWTRWAGVEELHPSPEPDDGWPPPAYRALAEPYDSLRRAPGELPPESAGKPPERWHRFRTIHQAVAPEPDDIVIATGEQLQRALRELQAGAPDLRRVRHQHLRAVSRLRDARDARPRLRADPAAGLHERDRNARDLRRVADNQRGASRP